jgi:hypothetical protein
MVSFFSFQAKQSTAVEEIRALIKRTSFPCPKDLDLNNTESLQVIIEQGDQMSL